MWHRGSGVYNLITGDAAETGIAILSMVLGSSTREFGSWNVGIPGGALSAPAYAVDKVLHSAHQQTAHAYGV